MMALPPRRALVRRAVELDQRVVDRRLVASRPCPSSSVAISPLTAATAPVDVEAAEGACRRRAGRPPRREPVEAPAGAMARPIAPPASVTSTSTVGRPRESQTRRPGPRRSSSSLMPESRLQASTNTRERHRRARQRSAARDAAHALPVALAGEVLDRRLAVDRARNRPAGARAARASRSPRGSHVDAGEIGVATARRSRRRSRAAPPGTAQALEQQVVEAEGEVEGRIAVPGAFGVEEDRAARARPGCSSG